MTTEVVLDTSVLLDLLSDASLRSAFVAKAAKGDALVVVPLAVLDEAFVNNKDRSAKAAALAELADRVRMRSMDGVASLVCLEHVLGGLAKTAVHAEECTINLVSELASMRQRQRVEQAVQHVSKWKRRAKVDDNQFRNRRRQAEPVRQLLEIVNSLTPLSLPSWVVEASLSRCFEHLAEPSRPAAREVLPLPLARRRALLAWSGFAFIAFVANLTTEPELTPFPSLAFLRRDRNDFYDANIAACAAYADLLLTKDANLLARAEFLRARAIVSFGAQDLVGFVANASST
ncbi:MAG: hypothetical protein Q8L14_13550 [Myxococcales bacterium]|nr:hypothetical protein [Myxococcales bacterium]